MADFTLRWANRSNSNQDWMISNGDSFTLAPNHVRSVNISINSNYTYQIAVSTEGGFASASLTYTASTGMWTLNSVTPLEWELAQGGGIVTVRCLLEDVRATVEEPSYTVVETGPADSEAVEGKVKYPAYQLFKDTDRETFCSKNKVKSHAEGNAWIKLCIEANGVQVLGKPWISDNQSGTIWPE